MTNPKRILVVDDEPQIHRFLKPSLIVSGYEVLTAVTGQQALRSLAADRPDAVLLDLGLPDMDGKEVIEQIRRQSGVPIIVLSARDRETEKIAALDLGADDYLNKPFGIGELLARLRSVLRRRPVPVLETGAAYAVGQVEIDTASHQVMRAGILVHFTPKEFDLLALLARHAGRVLTHRHILTEVWGPAHGADTQYLRVFIGQLRQKLEDDPSDPRLILTEPGTWLSRRQQRVSTAAGIVCLWGRNPAQNGVSEPTAVGHLRESDWHADDGRSRPRLCENPRTCYVPYAESAGAAMAGFVESGTSFGLSSAHLPVKKPGLWPKFIHEYSNCWLSGSNFAE